MPRSMLRLRVRLERVLDLTDLATAQRWSLSAEQLGDADLSACQAVARIARTDGYEAILFPAATGLGDNLAIFLDRLLARSSVTIEAIEPIVFE